jgi:hypothetical protein
MKKIIIFSALIISIILVFNSCTTSLDSNAISLSLSLTNDDSKSYITDIPLEFILKINLPLANNSLSNFYLEVSSDNGVVNNERYTLSTTADSTEINATVIDSKTVKISYTPEFSGKYIFTGYYQLANNPEISSNTYVKDIIGVNNKINGIELLFPEDTDKRILEGETEYTWVIPVNVSPKINLDLSLEDSVSADIRIEKRDGEQKSIEKVSDHQYNIDGFDSPGLYRLKVKLFDDNSAYPNIIYDTKDVIFIVSDDQNEPEINYVKNDNNEKIGNSTIDVETLSDLYNVNFDITDKDFGNSGLYSIKASVVSGDSTEVVFADKTYGYGTYEDTLNLNLNTNYSGYNIKIEVEDYVGEKTNKNYTVNIIKLESQANLEPRYSDNETLTYNYTNKRYEYNGGEDKLVDLVSEILTSKTFDTDVNYSFKITNQYGEIVGKLDRDGNITETFEATVLNQNRYTFAGYQLSEGSNILNLTAQIYSSDFNKIYAKNEDSINIFVEDITPPKIKKATIKLDNGDNVEIIPPNTGYVNYASNISWDFEIEFSDTSNIFVNTDGGNIDGEIIDPNGNNILNSPLRYTVNENKLIVFAPINFTNTLAKGSYEIRIFRDFLGTVQIEDEYGNVIREGQDYTIRFEVN